MATESATVETLTAEVRVLMVGNRQVTLSVARQLDIGRYWMTPFGRARITSNAYEYIILGRCGETGALVRSRMLYTYDSGWRVDQDLPLLVLAGLK